MRRLSIAVAALFILASAEAEAQARGGAVGGGAGHTGGTPHEIGGATIGTGSGTLGGGDLRGTLGGGDLRGTLGDISTGPDTRTGAKPVGGNPRATSAVDAQTVKSMLDDIVTDRLRAIRVGSKAIK